MPAIAQVSAWAAHEQGNYNYTSKWRRSSLVKLHPKDRQHWGWGSLVMVWINYNAKNKESKSDMVANEQTNATYIAAQRKASSSHSVAKLHPHCSVVATQA